MAMAVACTAGERTQGRGSHGELCLEQVLPLAGIPSPRTRSLPMAKPDLFGGYTPPQPAFRRCKCGALVMRLTRDEPALGLRKGAVVTPLLGLPHVCAKQKEDAA